MTTPSVTRNKLTTTKKTSKSLENSTSTNDLMPTFQTFREEFLTATNLQVTQFNELKRDIKKFSSLSTKLKTENTQLKEEIIILNNEVDVLEHTESPRRLIKCFEINLCQQCFGVGLSKPSPSASQRISDDKMTLEQTLGQHNSIIC